jgi:D-glycero-alpha-D-manno-heptose-7-phosphate kinase
MDKKSVVQEITQDYFDDIYNKVLQSGALGGKLLGAGGGGFFMFYVPLEKQENVRHELTKFTECKVYDFKFHNKGSEIVSA